MRSKGISSLLCLVSLLILTAPSFAEEGAPAQNQKQPLPFNTKIATLISDLQINGITYPKGTRVLQLTEANSKGEATALIINATYDDLALGDEELEKKFDLASIKTADINNDTSNLSYEGKIKSLEASTIVARFFDFTLNTTQFKDLSQPAFNRFELRVIKPNDTEEFVFQIHYRYPTFKFTTPDPSKCHLVTVEPFPNALDPKRSEGIAYFDSKIKTLKDEHKKQEAQIQTMLDVLLDFRGKNCKETNNKILKIKLFEHLKKLEKNKTITRLQHETIIMGLTLHGEAGASAYWDTRLQRDPRVRTREGINELKTLSDNTVLAQMIAAGSTIVNRTKNIYKDQFFTFSDYYPNNPGSIMAICTSDSQYSPWNSKQPKLREMICPTLPSGLKEQNIAIRTAFKMLDPTQNSNLVDPTLGSTHFYSPNGMPIDIVPDWVPDYEKIPNVKVTVTSTTTEDVTIDDWLYRFYRPPNYEAGNNK